MEDKCFHVSMGKTQILVSGTYLDLLKKSGKDLSAICLTGIGKMQCSVVWQLEVTVQGMQSYLGAQKASPFFLGKYLGGA